MTASSQAGSIILVEDDANDVVFVRQALETALIQNPLSVFASAAQVIEHLRSQPQEPGPVLVILDVTLAGAETGLDALAWIRAQPEPLGSTPAMMLTGSLRPGDRDDSRRLGVTTYLQKPVTEPALTRAVQGLGFVTVEHGGLPVIQRRDESWGRKAGD